jgi:hypothetical protein
MWHHIHALVANRHEENGWQWRFPLSSAFASMAQNRELKEGDDMWGPPISDHEGRAWRCGHGAKSKVARGGVGPTRCATGPRQPHGLAVAGEAWQEGWAG